MLPVSDVVRSTAWYQRLGFEVRAEYDGYAIVAFDGAEVHLNEFHDAPPATETFSGRLPPRGRRRRRPRPLGRHGRAAPSPRPRTSSTGSASSPPRTSTATSGGSARRIAGGPIDGWEPAEPSRPTSSPHRFDELADAAPRRSTRRRPEASDRRRRRAPADERVGRRSWPTALRCAGCGLVNGELAARAIGAQVRDEVHPFGELLAAADDDAVRRRPAPASWSALEYGVHVRDVLTVFAERIVRTLAEHQPELGWWDHEAAIADGMANESDVSAVVDDLQRNAAKLSEALRHGDRGRLGARRDPPRAASGSRSS